MARYNTQTIQEVLEQFKERWNRNGKLDELELRKWWEEMMGKLIAKHTIDIKVRKGKLHISLDSAVLKEELSYSKTKIMELVNEKLGRDAVEEIVIR